MVDTLRAQRCPRTQVHHAIKTLSPPLAAKVTEEIFDALAAQSVTLPAEATWGWVITDLLGDLERIEPAQYCVRCGQ